MRTRKRMNMNQKNCEANHLGQHYLDFVLKGQSTTHRAC